MWRLPKITIQFRSINDLKHVYWLELKTMKDVINTIENEQDLREVELELKEMLAVVEDKQRLNYLAKQERP